MIWKKDFTIEDINKGNDFYKNPFDIEFVEKGEDYLLCKMLVSDKTKQPMGLLHGGVSVYLAETIGSMAGYFCLPNNNKHVVGLDINANHIRGVKSGNVFAKAKPLHLGGKTQVWEIKITNESNKLVCISRLTLAVV